MKTQGSDTESTKEIDIPDLKKENLTTEKIGALLKKKLDLKLTAEDVRWVNRQLGFGVMSIFLRNNAILLASPDDKILEKYKSPYPATGYADPAGAFRVPHPEGDPYGRFFIGFRGLEHGIL